MKITERRDDPAEPIDRDDIDILLQLSVLHGARLPPGPGAEGSARERSSPGDRREADRLASSLSSSAARIYRSLVVSRKWPFAVALNHDWCGACNLRLPSALVGEIRREARLHRCPSCKRVVTTADTISALETTRKARAVSA
jgi:hypothetical protein